MKTISTISFVSSIAMLTLSYGYAAPSTISNMHAAAHQSKPIPIWTLSPVDKQHVLQDNFRVINRVRDIPGPVLSHVVGTTVEDGMADPGQRFQETDVVSEELPWKRLILAAVSKDYCIVYYDHGGIAYSQVACLFKITNEQVHLVWQANMGGQDTGQTLAGLQKEIANGNYAHY